MKVFGPAEPYLISTQCGLPTPALLLPPRIPVPCYLSSITWAPTRLGPERLHEAGAPSPGPPKNMYSMSKGSSVGSF